jgi:hypothetical protein
MIQLGTTHICYIDNFLDKGLCRALVEAFYMFKPQDAFVFGKDSKVKHSPTIRKSLIAEIPTNWMYASRAESILYNGFHRALQTYIETFPVLKQFAFEDCGYQLSRYEKNEGFYLPHADGGVGALDRIVSAIVYLNDVDEGGGTRFHNQDLTVQPREGRMVMFPSAFTHMHEALKPISDHKYILTTFFSQRRQDELS